MDLEIWQRWTIVILVILSVLFILFFISRFSFRRLLPKFSPKQILLFSGLTTLVLTPAVLYLIAYLVFTPRIPDLKDNLAGWEIKTTFQVYPSRSISIEDKRLKINSGENSVLIVSREMIPVVKEGQTEPTDLRSIRNLIIELNQADTLVNPTNLGSSKILREILAFSPSYGTNLIDIEEKIEIRKIGNNRWEINSDLEDFQFKGEFSFNDSSRVTTKYIEKW